MKTEKEAFAEMLRLDTVPDLVNERLAQTYASLAPKKHARRPLRVLLIAAAVCALFTTGVFATQQIYKMLHGDIPFYAEQKPAQPLDSIREGTQNYNAEINQTVTDAGISVTLNHISVYESFVNAYFTIQKEGGLNLAESPFFSDVNDISLLAPEWIASALEPHFRCSINGAVLETVIDQDDTSDLYLVDDNTFQYMTHYAVADTLPQQFTLALCAFSYETPTGNVVGRICETEGSWTFEIPVDIGETLAATKCIQPQEVVFHTQDGDKTLDLRKFTVAPSGCIAVYGETFEPFSEPIEPYTLGDGTVVSTVEGEKLPDNRITLSQLALRDDQGNWLYAPAHGGMSGTGARDFNLSEITGLAPNATSVTMIPLISAGENTLTHTVRPLAQGQKNELDSASGVEIISVEATAYGIKIIAKPYGNIWAGLDFLLCDADGKEPQIHGYRVSQTDRKTGTITTILGAYRTEDIAALQQCTHFISRSAEGIALDEAAAVTLPLT